MAPLGLAMRPARAIIFGRGTVETAVVAHLGISHDLLELPQRQHPSRDLGDRRTRLSSASNAVDKGSAGVRQVRSPTHQAVHRPERHAETPPICGPDPCLVAVIAISQATPWLNWEEDPTRFSGRAPKFSLERSIRNVCRISAILPRLLLRRTFETRRPGRSNALGAGLRRLKVYFETAFSSVRAWSIWSYA